jgi:hypothetical protein
MVNRSFTDRCYIITLELIPMNAKLLNPDSENHQTPRRIVIIKSEWLYYLSKTATNINDLNPNDQYRINLTQMMHYQQLSGRQLFHMTLTYKPFQNYTYKPELVNKFFINFYVKSFLPVLLQTRNIHTTYKKSIQPICLSFIDEHEMTPVSTDTGTEFPLRLHHHAIIAVHPDTMKRFTPLVGTNTLQNMSKINESRYNYKVMTSDIRECDAQRLLYASKCYIKYPDYLQFPNTFQRNHCSHKSLRVKNEYDKSSIYSNS